MRKSITKANVIKALQKEKLKRKNFFHGVSGLLWDIKCSVCAVGAVLRKMSFEEWAKQQGWNQFRIGEAATKGIYSSNHDYKRLIKEKNYLGALSCYFEKGNSKKKCIEFVKQYFPSKLTIEIKEDL